MHLTSMFRGQISNARQSADRSEFEIRLAVAHGFSLHADTATHAHDRQGLEYEWA
jgi:hypothetical protein